MCHNGCSFAEGIDVLEVLNGRMVLKEQTQQWLADPILGDDDIDAKVRRLLEAEYLRKMAQHQRVNETLSQKYGVTFDQFVAQDVVVQHGYSWEVEQDAMQWEIAIGGIETLRRRLQEIGKRRVPSLAEYRLEAFQALDTFWFIQAVEEIDHTDVTLSLRQQIRSGLFVQSS